MSSNFLTLAILIVLGWLVYYSGSRRPRLSFFGIRRTKKLVVYLSNLGVRSGGSTGVDGTPSSFGESAIPVYEAKLMPALQRLFNYVVPGMEGLPGFLNRLLLSDVDVEILASPLDVKEIEGDFTFMAVGSPGYNLAASYVENSLHSIGRFTDDMAAVTLPGAVPLSGDHAFVQRAGNSKRTAIYVAGATSRATTGAVRFLATRWRYLHKKYPRGKAFCVMLLITSEDGSTIKSSTSRNSRAEIRAC
jgi:hypothetical protein